MSGLHCIVMSVREYIMHSCTFCASEGKIDIFFAFGPSYSIDTYELYQYREALKGRNQILGRNSVDFKRAYQFVGPKFAL